MSVQPLKEQQRKIKKIKLKSFKSGVPKAAKSTKRSKLSWLYFSLITGVTLFLYLFKIRSLPPVGNDGSLSVTHNNLSDIDTIDFLPIKLVSVFFDKIGINNSLDIRLFSVFIFLLSLFFFYKLATNWLDKRMSVIALFLYASSTWAIAVSRHDSEFIMLAVFLPVLLFCGRLLLTSSSKLIRVVCALTIAQFIFVPGGIWFILLSAIAALLSSEKQIKFKDLVLPLGAAAMVVVGYGLLLAHLSLTGFAQLLRVVGFQVGEFPAMGTVKANVTELPGQLFVNGLNDGSMWLHLTPIIDWVAAILFVLGVLYLIVTKYNSFRARYLLLLSLLCLVLIFINGPFYISLLLPLIYLVIAIGVDYLARDWLDTFPNNPLARSLGVILILMIVALTCAYHVERYFIGWPKSEKYQQIFKA